MEFKVTIVFDASPALVGAVSRITDALSTKDFAPVLQVTEAGTIKGFQVAKPVIDAVREEKALQATVQESAQTASEPDNAEAKYTLVQVRKIMADVQDSKPDNEKRAVMQKMKSILATLGAESIGKLPEEKYGEFIQQISAL